MTFLQRTRFALLVARRIPAALFRYPVYTLQLTWKRLMYAVTRRFTGHAVRSPITGELVFNQQSLITAYAFHVVRELDGPWIDLLRETPQPVVFDVGSNIGQFRAYVRSKHPAAVVYTVDCWPDLACYVPREYHLCCALGSPTSSCSALTTSTTAWTGSTRPNADYNGKRIRVNWTTLDQVWNQLNRPAITVLKLDIDGGEIEALEGAKEALAATKAIIVETAYLDTVKELCPGRTWTTVNGFDYCGILT